MWGRAIVPPQGPPPSVGRTGRRMGRGEDEQPQQPALLSPFLGPKSAPAPAGLPSGI